jgi:hypothetical protein
MFIARVVFNKGSGAAEVSNVGRGYKHIVPLGRGLGQHARPSSDA